MDSKDLLKTEDAAESNSDSSKETNIHNAIKIEKETIKQGLQKEIDDETLQGFHMENCIIIVGGSYDNTVINSGEINGGVTQQHHSTHQEKASGIKRKLIKETDLAEFIKDYAGTTIFYALISLTALEIIPENKLYYIVNLLFNRFTKDTDMEGTASDVWKEKMILPFEDLLDTIGARRVEAVQKSNAGDIPISCMAFENAEEIQWLCRALWNNYPQYREVIVNWLFDLKDDPLIKGLISFQIAGGMSRFAKVDFNYANDYIIGRLASKKQYDDLKYLVIILNDLKEQYSKNIDCLLCYWLNNDTVLWQVGYRMYAKGQDFDYLTLVERKIKGIIEADMKPEIMKYPDLAGWFSASRNDIVIPAHFQTKLAELMIRTLSLAFSKCKSFDEQKIAALYFLILFREDFLCAHRPYHELIFIRAFNHETKKDISALVLFIWARTFFQLLPMRIVTWRKVQLKRLRDMNHFGSRQYLDMKIMKMR